MKTKIEDDDLLRPLSYPVAEFVGNRRTPYRSLRGNPKRKSQDVQNRAKAVCHA